MGLGLRWTELIVLACPVLALLAGTFFAGFVFGKGKGFKEGLRERERMAASEKRT